MFFMMVVLRRFYTDWPEVECRLNFIVEQIQNIRNLGAEIKYFGVIC